MSVRMGVKASKWKRRLRAWEEEMVGKCCVLVHNVVLHVQVEDQWHWLLDHVKGYTISCIYHYLISSEGPAEVERMVDILHKKVSLKVKLFV